MELWPHQKRGLDMAREAIKEGCRSMCLVAPPGAGKTVLLSNIAIPAAERGKTTFIYTHRIMLTKQMAGVFSKMGANIGIIASSRPDEYNPDAKIQIASIQTVHARMKSKQRYEWPKADIVIVDEYHANTESTCKAVYQMHEQENEKVVRIGFTATPTGLKDVCQRLINAGTYGEMLECKAHLPVHCYGPDRPDLSQLKPMKSGDFSSEDDCRINRVPTIFGRVYEYWQRLNPNALPAVGFAPGVPESKWFVHDFMQKGVACCHIDAARSVFVRPNSKGELEWKEYETDDSTRAEALDGVTDGRYKILWNRFLMREAVDAPALFHCITATSMGSVSTYLQSTGRVLRYYKDYDHVVYQDHGGNLDRHGLPNVERNWSIDCTNSSIHQEEVKERQKKKGDDAEPICCPRCSAYRLHGPQCHSCGYMHDKSVRMVRQLDGTLVKKTGRVVPHKAPKVETDQSRWDGLFWAGKNSKKEHPPTFAQMSHIFKKKYGYELPSNLRNIPPKNSLAWSRAIKYVKRRELQ
jgi:DNA repair protein RadD